MNFFMLVVISKFSVISSNWFKCDYGNNTFYPELFSPAHSYNDASKQCKANQDSSLAVLTGSSANQIFQSVNSKIFRNTYLCKFLFLIR